MNQFAGQMVTLQAAHVYNKVYTLVTRGVAGANAQRISAIFHHQVIINSEREKLARESTDDLIRVSLWPTKEPPN